MYRLIAGLLLTTMPAFADETAISDLIAEKGLEVAKQQLESTPASPDRNMALAAVRFLSGIETAYQERWRIGSTTPILPGPIMGTNLMTVNPAPEEMQPDFINNLAVQIAGTMRSTREIIPNEPAALALDLEDLWFDIDVDGERQPNENLLHLVTIPVPEGATTIVRFDAADAEWLRAYTHLIEAASTLLIAFDTEPALVRQISLLKALQQQKPDVPLDDGMPDDSGMSFRDQVVIPIVDGMTAAVSTLGNQPDKVKIKEVHENLIQMIAANRKFWSLVAEETDNKNEWIPNDRQTAALGFDIPKGAGTAWLAILDDVEMALKGEKLIPYWRFDPGYGINLKKWVDDPKPIDLITWIHGSAALPYATKGKTVDADSWNNFTGSFGNQRAGLYMILFN